MSHTSARDSWTLTGKSGRVSYGVTSLLLSPGSWCVQDFVCDLQECVSPVLWKFYNQIPLAFKVKFPEDSQALLYPWVGDLENCCAVCGSFARPLCGGADGDLLQEDLCHGPSPPVCYGQSPCAHSSPLLTHASAGDMQTGLSVSCGVPGSWFTQGFVCTLQVSLEGMRFASKCNLAPPAVLLGLLLSPRHRVSFFGGIQCSPVNGGSAASCNFGVLAGENECTSFYSTILDDMKLSSLSHLGKPLLLLFSCSVMSDTLQLFTGVNCTEKVQIKYSIVRYRFNK